MKRQLLTEYLDHFEQLGSEAAYVHRRGYRTESWTYLRIAQAAYQFARELEARQVGKGDRVLLWGSNCAEWVVAFLGCAARGAVVVPMDRIAAPDFVARVASQVDARLLIRSCDLPQWPAQPPVLTLETLSDSIAGRTIDRYRNPELQATDAVEIVFTSGTTAEPRGVVISHRNILANLAPLEVEIEKYLKYARLFHPIRFLNLLPLSHVFGQFLGILIPQLMGGLVVFQEALNPSEIIDTIRRHRISVLVAVPRLLQTLRGKIERDMSAAMKMDGFRMQFRAADGEHFLKRWWRFRKIHSQFGWKFWSFVCGGATLDSETETFWGRLGYVVVQGYGLTETTSLISVNHPMRLAKGSIGKVLPGREIKLDAGGEILVRGESIATDYWDGKGLQPVLGQEGWFHTGDIGEMDEDGQLYFKGRQKNVIVTPEGMNIYPEDLEAALRRQQEVRDCVVVGLARGGNAEPCAVLLLCEECDPVEIVRRSNAELAEYQQIRHWHVWPDRDFPRTSTQKPRIREILDAVESRMGKAQKVPHTTSTVAELIERIAGQRFSGFAPESQLTADLNLSSIERVELLGALEDRYQIDLDESQLTGATTVGDLDRMLQQPAMRRSEYRYPSWTQRWPVTWIRPFFYYLLAWPATYLLGWPRILGKKNLAAVYTPVLVIANHITSIDVGFVLAALPMRIRHRLAVAMEGERLRGMRRPARDSMILRRWLEQIKYLLVVGLMNVFPLPQGSGFRQAFAYAGQSVDRGYSILVFPEGRMTRDGRMGAFQGGIGLLAKNLDIPIVPVRIDGLFELKQAGRKIARPGEIRITVGSPVRFEPGSDPMQIVCRLESCVASLASASAAPLR